MKVAAITDLPEKLRLKGEYASGRVWFALPGGELQELCLGPSLKIINYPFGFNWSYGGAGFHLALALLLELLEEPLAVSLARHFAWACIDRLPHGDFDLTFNLRTAVTDGTVQFQMP